MTELKTLKDFVWLRCEFPAVEIIKEEAIKWVKTYYTKIEEYSQVKVMMYFFNLTEEDLK